MKETAMRVIVAVTIGLAMTVAPADAQPAPWQPERLTPGWVFVPGAALNVMWDSNVTVVGQGAPETAEWVGVVNPRGELVYNGRHTRFNGGYSGAFERYRTLDALNRYEQRARLNLHHQATPRLAFDSMAALTLTPTTDRLEEIGTLPFLRIGSRLFDAGGSSSYRLTPRTSLEGNYRFQQVDFDREQTAQLPAFLTGGYQHSPGVHLGHDLTSRLSAGTSYEYRLAVVGDGASHFKVQNALADVRYRLTENTVVAGAAGASNLHVAGTDIRVWGPAYRASLEHRRGLTEVSLRYDRSFVPSFSFGGLTGNQFFSASASTPLTRSGRLTLGGSTTYSITEPVESLGFTFQANTWRFNGSVGYQVSRWLRTDVFVTDMRQTTTAQGDVDRTRVGIQFVTSKPVRIQ
jgi:hypothetical protein